MPGGLCGPEDVYDPRFDQLNARLASGQQGVTTEGALPRGDIAPLADTAALELSVPLNETEST